MTLDYSTLLTDEQKHEILSTRIAQFAAEAYQHTLNKKASEVAEDTVAIESADRALALLDAAIKVYQEELDKVKPHTH